MLDTWQQQRDDVLRTMLEDVAFDGWRAETLDSAMRKHDLSSADIRLLFPRGIPDVLAHLSDWADRQMLEQIALTPDFITLRVRDRIAFGVRARLMAMQPWRGAVQSSLGLLARPDLAGLALKTTWHTADRLWHAAGDTSTDYNHYTKRGLLVGVLSSTSIYWLHDTSENFDKSWAFLDQRIADVLKYGGILRRIIPTKKAA